MKFKPFDRMWDVVETQRDISDTDYFNSLMYLGRMMAKFAVSGIVAAVNESQDRHQYRLRKQLVESDGIGKWSQVLDEVLTGVAAQYLCVGVKGEGNETYQLTKKTTSQDWQHKSVTLLRECLKIAHPNVEYSSKKIQGRIWFSTFAELRNKTQGHGALGGGQIRNMCSDLHESISIVIDNFRLFHRPWAYLVQTQKRKYHVVRWTEASSSLRILQTKEGTQFNFPEGVYIHFGDQIDRDSLRIAKLIHSNVDASDFYVPNGGWNEKRFEMRSFITNDTIIADSQDYLDPVELPQSETQGLSCAVLKGRSGSTITNVPNKNDDYISRPAPENRLLREIVEETPHHIITLRGRGGIGKTWLTLKVLDDIANEENFTAILWFSARDVDLSTSGPLQVKPDILDIKDIAQVFHIHMSDVLLSAEELHDDGLDKTQFLLDNMRHCELGKILFVFDNFETVTSPIELYNTIYNNVKPPNKAVVTTRVRDFKGDYWIELEGMSYEECNNLIDATARRLKVNHLVSTTDKERLFEVSAGHPYVVKMLLGGLRKPDNAVDISTMMAHNEDLLDALFERTYSQLSRIGQRVFLTLCSWKSLVAETAISAILLRPNNTDMGDIIDAIYELYDSSLVEKTDSSVDNETYWTVNLLARQFGVRKIESSTIRMAIQADKEFLQYFGVTQKTDMKRSIQSRIDRLLREIQKLVIQDHSAIEEFVPIIEYMAKRRHHQAWLKLADLYKKIGNSSQYEYYLKRFLEFATDNEEKRKVWENLANFYKLESRYSDELDASIRLAQLSRAYYETISNVANRFNSIVNLRDYRFDEGEKDMILETLIELMEDGNYQADATDFSRLGWLYMHDSKPEKALQTANRGLEIQPQNEYCKNLRQTAINALN